jgi:hypothetical protein
MASNGHAPNEGGRQADAVRSGILQHRAFARSLGAVRLAQAAEEAGFESLGTVDHVVIPAEYRSVYPYDPSGRLGPDDTVFPDPLIWLSYVAAATSTLRLGTAILILPQRNPVILAKELTMLDFLPGGRVLLGVGVGRLKEEYEALGVPWEGRERRAAKEAGRDPSAIEVTIDSFVSSGEQDLADVKALEALGASRVLIPAGMFGADPAPALRRYAEDVISRV